MIFSLQQTLEEVPRRMLLGSEASIWDSAQVSPMFQEVGLGQRLTHPTEGSCLAMPNTVGAPRAERWFSDWQKHLFEVGGTTEQGWSRLPGIVALHVALSLNARLLDSLHRAKRISRLGTAGFRGLTRRDFGLGLQSKWVDGVMILHVEICWTT